MLIYVFRERFIIFIGVSSIKKKKKTEEKKTKKKKKKALSLFFFLKIVWNDKHLFPVYPES